MKSKVCSIMLTKHPLLAETVISAETASFGRITERGESRKAETETCFGRNFWPKPNRNSIRLTTILKVLLPIPFLIPSISERSRHCPYRMSWKVETNLANQKYWHLAHIELKNVRETEQIFYHRRRLAQSFVHETQQQPERAPLI